MLRYPGTTQKRALVCHRVRDTSQDFPPRKGATDTGRTTRTGFFGEEEKKLRMPPLESRGRWRWGKSIGFELGNNMWVSPNFRGEGEFEFARFDVNEALA